MWPTSFPLLFTLTLYICRNQWPNTDTLLIKLIIYSYFTSFLCILFLMNILLASFKIWLNYEEYSLFLPVIFFLLLVVYFLFTLAFTFFFFFGDLLFFKYQFLKFNCRLITLGFAIHQHESTTGIHVFPILNPPPSPYHPSGSSQCTSPKHPVSCIEPGLATCFIQDILHVSMPFSQIFPPSPSPTESIRLFYTSVPLLLSLTQGYCYHLSKFHIYALVYCIGVFLSGLLHSV